MAQIIIADVDCYDPSIPGLRTLRFATQGYTTGAGDTPAHTFYEGRIQSPANITRSCFDGGASTSGPSSIGYGDLVLVNNDGALDGLLDYSFAGRSITIKLGTVLPNSGGVPTWVTILKGVMEQAEFSWQRVTMRVRDRQQDLAKPLQQSRFGGSNALPSGLDGVATDLKGRPKPIVLGQVFNAPLPLVNSQRLIYQAHDGALASVDAVYDRGAPLAAGAAYPDQATMESAAPSAGQYRVWSTAAGTFIRIGSQPSGTITADLTQGATAAARTAAQLWQAVLLRAGISAGDIVASDVSALDAATSAPVGVFIGSDRDMSALEACDLIAQAVGAWFGSDALGRFRIGRIELPSIGASVGTLTTTDIIRIERVAPRDPGVGVPAWKVKLGYARIWAVQDDLTNSVTAARKGYLAQEYRREEASDAAVKTANLTSPELDLATVLVAQSDAAAEAARRLAIYKQRRDMLQVRVRVDASLAAALDLGKVVTLRLDRYGMSAGKAFLVVGLRSDMRNYCFDLNLWG